eukprot:TRINITY_DN13097_c0_g2_i1.p1 TRINITY_DN13097_c0_g2~~TRINITY_DN13097_c0_g2_i1.p1  ORF type:complete len:345 (+),score=80.10 TRINITY_DN13097_c0_g2_i1:65-1036(+)
MGFKSAVACLMVGAAAAWTPLGPNGREYEKQMKSDLYKMRIIKNEALTGDLNVLANATQKVSSRCSSGNTISCDHSETHISNRWVGYQVPLGTAPKGGWPFVILFHGWGLMNSEWCWYAQKNWNYGLYYKAETIKKLLDAGYGVITPDSSSELTYWDTNEEEYANSDLAKWDKSKDHAVVDDLVKHCKDGTFGPCNTKDIHAMGFSSGGYMSSRVAVNYGKSVFQSVSLMAGSYYYCYGSDCSDAIAKQVPSSVWDDHPPTLFLHGTRDGLVPTDTSEIYYNFIKNKGVETKRLTTNGKDHQWTANAPAQILAWVETHSSSKN